MTQNLYYYHVEDVTLKYLMSIGKFCVVTMIFQSHFNSDGDMSILDVPQFI